MPPSFLYEPPGFTAGFTSNEADWEAGEWEHGRSLTSPCDNECGTATCAFFNSSFSCERLSTLYCSCEGCCFHAAEPLGASGAMLIFFSCVWALFMMCNLYYRYFAMRETKAVFGGRLPPRNPPTEGLEEEQLSALRQRRRYRASGINAILPFVAGAIRKVFRPSRQATPLQKVQSHFIRQFEHTG